jgi:hypothetical protein
MNDHSACKKQHSGQPFVGAKICDIRHIQVHIHGKGAGMRKIVFVLCMVAFFYSPVAIHAMEVTVDIAGSQELGSLKAGIEKTVIARCIAKGIPVESYKKLNITISKLGDVISYDALLDTAPPKAFHKDLKDTSTISGTIDEMIGTIFIAAAPKTQTSILPGTAQKSIVGSKIKLPFIATSIASLGEKIFVSDMSTVYELKGEKASPVWHTPGKVEILRIYPYEETLIVLAKNGNYFRTFKIKDAKTLDRWDKAVVPLGQGLILSELNSDLDMSERPYTWVEAKQIAGSSPQIPKGLDITAAVSSEISPTSQGSEILSYTEENRLAVSSGRSILWKASTDAGIVPSFIEDAKIKPPVRYYLKPRIVITGGRIITFKNEQGLGRMLVRFNLFESSKILVYTASGEEFEEAIVATFPESYCSDITLASGKVAALIVKEKNSYLQFLDL